MHVSAVITCVLEEMKNELRLLVLHTIEIVPVCCCYMPACTIHSFSFMHTFILIHAQLTVLKKLRAQCKKNSLPPVPPCRLYG